MANLFESRPVHADTSAVHAGREDFIALGVHAPPLDLSTSYPLGDIGEAVASLDDLVAGRAEAPNSFYARLHNPTVARFERALAQLEGTEDAVAFSSGMAAVTACLLAGRERGDHVVAVRPLYGGTDALLESGLLGMSTSFVPAQEVGDAVRVDTALVVIETPANPTLKLTDIEDVVRQAGEVPVLVDSTFATPILLQPARFGARCVLHSATKFLGGHGDVLAGIVATDREWAARLRQVRILTGGVLHPLAGYLLHRGLATLSVRVHRAQRTAMELARRLSNEASVTRVLYPGLPEGDPLGLVGRQMEGPGSLISFEIDGGLEEASAVMTALRVITPAVSLGSTDSLIQHPAALTHRVVSEGGRDSGGITEGMLRLSVGLEHVEDLWDDLRQALHAGLGKPRNEVVEEVAMGG